MVDADACRVSALSVNGRRIGPVFGRSSGSWVRGVRRSIPEAVVLERQLTAWMMTDGRHLRQRTRLAVVELRVTEALLLNRKPDAIGWMLLRFVDLERAVVVHRRLELGLGYRVDAAGGSVASRVRHERLATCAGRVDEARTGSERVERAAGPDGSSDRVAPFESLFRSVTRFRHPERHAKNDQKQSSCRSAKKGHRQRIIRPSQWIKHNIRI